MSETRPRRCISKAKNEVRLAIQKLIYSPDQLERPYLDRLSTRLEAFTARSVARDGSALGDEFEPQKCRKLRSSPVDHLSYLCYAKAYVELDQ
jgi:hypothetical protein